MLVVLVIDVGDHQHSMFSVAFFHIFISLYANSCGLVNKGRAVADLLLGSGSTVVQVAQLLDTVLEGFNQPISHFVLSFILIHQAATKTALSRGLETRIIQHLNASEKNLVPLDLRLFFPFPLLNVQAGKGTCSDFPLPLNVMRINYLT